MYVALELLTVDRTSGVFLEYKGRLCDTIQASASLRRKDAKTGISLSFGVPSS